MELTAKIRKQFGKFRLDADFQIQGNKIGVFGPSGGGKSTLVSLIAGLRHPDEGIIVLDGEPLFDSSRGVHVPVEHRRIGMVFQKAHLFPHLSVKNNLLYGYKRCEAKDRQITFDSVVEVMQLKHLLGRGIKNLSGGEKQRVAIGRAVLSNPKLLLMDEPLSAIDENLKFQIMTYLKDTCDVFRIPYFFISHSLLEMRVMTDTVLTMANGTVTGQITTENLARNTMIVENRYVNLLRLTAPKPIHDIYSYRWGDQELFVSSGSDLNETLFELASTDIILFKRHPEAVSARNLLKAQVSKLLHRGAVVGVELKCGSEVMVSEITRRALNELQISEGSEVYAAIKAVAFRRLG